MSFEDEIEEMEQHQDLAYDGHLEHEDGSHTFIMFGDQDDFEFSNPRDNDGNIAHLVSTNSNYHPIDAEDDDLESMRQAADFLGQRHIRTTTNQFGRHGAWELVKGNPGEAYLHIDSGDSNGRFQITLDLDDWHQAYAALGFFLGLDASETVQYYIDRVRPDIAHYEHEWTLHGTSQGDWREGWAYVTWADLENLGCNRVWMAKQGWTPEILFDKELEVYGKWFSGEVYWAKHIAPAGLEHAIGDEGGYYLDTHEFTEDSCGGFLGYDDNADIAAHFTDSPVIRPQRSQAA